MRLQYLKSNPVEYAPALRLLQDLCSISGELPSCFRLSDVTFNRGDLVGRGGEASVYAGCLNSQKVVVREVVMRRNFWRSPEGKKVIKVIAKLRSNIKCRFNFDIQFIHREAITHSLLDHPNIIPFLGVYSEYTDTPPMVVLPFVERGSLSDLLLEKSIRGVEFAWIVCFISQRS
jgi:serine/threonine protein kinase